MLLAGIRKFNSKNVFLVSCCENFIKMPFTLPVFYDIILIR